MPVSPMGEEPNIMVDPSASDIAQDIPSFQLSPVSGGSFITYGMGRDERDLWHTNGRGPEEKAEGLATQEVI